jgi:hypothetical protein
MAIGSALNVYALYGKLVELSYFDGGVPVAYARGSDRILAD